jgi:hypothetical protein
MLRPYRRGNRISFFTRRRNLPLSHCMNCRLKKHTTLMAVSDGGANELKTYRSFGWVLGIDQEIQWECKGIARGYQMQSYRAEGYGRLSLLSFLTHYLHLEIQTSDDLRITSYCDNYTVCSKARKLFTFGILTHQVGTRSLITM